MNALTFLSTLVCGKLIMAPQLVENLAWCEGKGLAAVWRVDPRDDMKAVALVECEEPKRYFVGDEERNFVSFDTIEEWIEFVER